MALLLVMLLAFSSVALAAGEVSVRAGKHANYSRLVFDWKKIARYQVTQSGDKLDIIFERSGNPKISHIKAARYSEIDSIKIRPSGKNKLHVQIDLAEGVTYKHNRLLRKVVFDFKKGSQKTKAPKQMKAEPVEYVEKKVLKKPVHKKKHSPIEETTEVPPPLKKAHKSGKIIVDKTKQENEAEATKVKINPQRTVISISTLEPSNFAVFERFGYLWMVLDNDLGNIPPEKFGALTGVLGKPERIEAEGGSAYRYTLPKGIFVSINKESLSWQIILSRTSNVPIFSNAHVFPDFGRSGRARLIAVLPPAKGKIVKVKDPTVGDDLWVIPVSSAGLKVDQLYETSDLEIMPAHLGMVLRPKRDDIKVYRHEKKIFISASGGLNLTPGVSAISNVKDKHKGGSYKRRIFDFPNWQQGGVSALLDTKRILERELLTVQNPSDRSEILFRLALLHFSNNMAHESIGLLRLVAEENPTMAKQPSFHAIRGAVRALAGQYLGSIEDLSIPSLMEQPEAKLWRGYAAAATEQWNLAAENFPKDNFLLGGYPSVVAIPFTIYMAESALRIGERDRARELLGTLNVYADELLPRHRSAIAYLKGEAYRQNGEKEKAILIWQPVVDGRDRLYHAKAGIALTNLLHQEGRIDDEKALERLENLRYAWRGDGLEIRILQSIGSFRIKTGKYHDGLKQLRSAVELAQGSFEDSSLITHEMMRAFADLYVHEKATDIPPLEAVSIFDEFRELMPSGADGTKASENFADYLVRMDLLERAVSVLEDRILENNGTLAGSRIGARMASIYLLDSKPKKAVEILKKTKVKAMGNDLKHDRELMLARAFSQMKRPKQAISALSSAHSEDAQRLRADIHWRAGHWAEAARALTVLLPNLEKIEGRLTEKQTKMILNVAVAFKLSGEDGKLVKLKKKYEAKMAKTKLASSFAVVTRPAESGALSDRQTMLNLASEVDVFKGFLDSYKANVN